MDDRPRRRWSLHGPAGPRARLERTRASARASRPSTRSSSRRSADRRDGARPRRARGHPLDAPARAPRGRLADERRGAARRAHDAAASPATRRRRPRWRGRSSGCCATRTRWTGRCAPASDDYLDAVVKETLRLRPVLPLVVRKLKAPMEIGGYDLPGGRDGRAVHPPDPPPRGRLPRAARASGPSASSSSPPARTRGSRSAAACGAAWARASPCSR